MGIEYELLSTHKHPLFCVDALEEGDEEIRHQKMKEVEEHTLMSVNEEHMYDGEKFPSCALCEELIILGPCYSCSKRGCSYYLHKSCAEAPKTMHHPMHPQHPLTFTLRGWYMIASSVCGSCRRKTVNYLRIYRCENCDFYLDMNCALRSQEDHKIVVNTRIHEHPLISLGREALIFCDACGREHKDFFYICTTCSIEESKSESAPVSFIIHRNCASLPNTIKYRHHHHNLNLSYSLPTEYSQFSTNCKICSEWLNPKYWIYYCGGCRYFVHVHCATLVGETSKTEPCCEIDTYTTYTDPNVIRLPLPNESVSLISHLIKQMTLEDKKRERITELNHYSHNHPLILHDPQSNHNSCSTSKSSLSTSEVKNDEICNLCKKPIIMNALFYNCTQCCFSLHEFCAELPAEGQYPGHPKHSLILRAKASTTLDWSYCHYCYGGCLCFHSSQESRDKCTHCCPISDDYALYCSSCKFYLHLKCVLSPGAITHEIHPQHVLVLRENLREKSPFWGAMIRVRYGQSRQCYACGGWTDITHAYECAPCSFQLHISCAFLPQTVKHRYDEHPFTLTYSPLEDHPMEYLCEICEKEINPKFWFYHCIECDQSLHIRCFIT